MQGFENQRRKALFPMLKKATKKVWFIFAGLLCSASIANPDSCPPPLPGIALWLNTWIFHGKPKPFQLLHVIHRGNCRLPKKTHFHTTHLCLCCKYLAQKSTPVLCLPVQVRIPCALSWDSAGILAGIQGIYAFCGSWVRPSLIHSFGWSVTAPGSLRKAEVSAWLSGSPWEPLERGKVFLSGHLGQEDPSGWDGQGPSEVQFGHPVTRGQSCTL